MPIKVQIPKNEYYDESTNTFIETRDTTLVLEHSLVSISKWESKWHKPFISNTDKTFEESIDYIKCMTITQNVPNEVYYGITEDLLSSIDSYITDSQSATWFRETQESPSREVITSELIYYWMIACGIPMECQKWHLNRLLTLIRICNVKNSPNKKMSSSELASRNRALNAARRKQHNTRG